jgi:HEAT repeat protein
MSDIAQLIAALYSDDRLTRRNATFDLIGGGGAVIEPLLPLLQDDNADVRYAAALVLDQLKQFVSVRLFTNVTQTRQHLQNALQRLQTRPDAVDDDKFVAAVIRQLWERL